ncbi:L-asparagine oxygenase [Lentzea waywayandensis]|uniref:L-asparagine oxygenase n=1 Tax=Lentzea waywayandensis TaxID=84724 RepID=A0A1I6FFN7_9PSEU|nr:TauD/TfdA family dioxygenase [Lentzea waywayandensis]SFR28738.1 L-asparagine oxygenase [Lentzea waywayandensis]
MGSEPAGADPRPLDDVAIPLTDSEREAIRGGFDRFARARVNAVLDSEELLVDAELAGRALPDRVISALRHFRRYGNGAGALLIRNAPVDTDLPATPQDGYVGHWNEIPVSTFTQLAVASQVGDVIAYADEKDGNLIQDVVPIKGARQRQENSGTVYLELHTENGFHPHKPDFITLLCLRPDHDRTSHTVVGGVAEVLPKLSEWCVSALRRKEFRLRVSSSFGAGADLETPSVAVLSGPVGAPEFLADFHTMEPLTPDAAVALDELKQALLTSLRGAKLDTGDLLVIDNRTAVHGRTPFAARYDETDRWLRRCFAVSDLRRSRGIRAPGSRVCEPLTVVGLSCTVAEELRCTTS